jgi:hypothetical protein
MSPRLIDLTGQRFGRWTVLGNPERHHYGTEVYLRWPSRCDCGTQRSVWGNALRTGRSTSCGCLHREKTTARVTTHGMSGTRVYQCWQDLLRRCLNRDHRQYDDYGGRGIAVCKRWETFENFYADMGDPPPGLSIDRINNDGNYEPSNCRWTTRAEQNRNRRPAKRKARRAKLADINAYVHALTRAGMRVAP